MPDIEQMAMSFTAFFDNLEPDADVEHGSAMVGQQPQDTGQNMPVNLLPYGFLAALNYEPAQIDEFDNLMQQSLDERAPYKNVLDESKENRIKYGVVAEGEEITCCIAQAPLEPGDQIATLPCGHIFERDSVMQWLKSERAECPVCRAPLESKEVREEVREEAHEEAIEPHDAQEESFISSYLNTLIGESLQWAAEREEEMALQAALMDSLGLE